MAVAADWPGLERGGKTEDEAVEKLGRYVPRYLPVAKRVRLDTELATQTDPEIIGRYLGVGSTTSGASRSRPRRSTASRSTRRPSTVRWGCCAPRGRVRRDGRPGLGGAPARSRGGGRSRDQIVRHVLGNEGGDFAKRVKAKTELDDLQTPGEVAQHRDRFVEAMRTWYAEGKPLGNWTVPYLLRHTAYHVLDHTWEMQDRNLTDDAPAG